MPWPYGRRRLRPGLYPAAAGTWRASTGFRKLTRPASLPPELYSQPISRAIATEGQASGVVGAGGSVTLQAGPTGLGATWQPQQAGIGTSVGAADSATCAIYVGPQPTPPYLVAQSYAGGGDAIGLAGYVLQPGEFVFAVWSGGTAGSSAQLKITGASNVLTA